MDISCLVCETLASRPPSWSCSPISGSLAPSELYLVKTFIKKMTDIELYSPTPVNKLCGSNLENFPQGQSKLSAKINEVPYKATVSVKRRQLTVILLSKVNLIPGISTEKKKNRTLRILRWRLCYVSKLNWNRRVTVTWRTEKQASKMVATFQASDPSDSMHETWQK